MKKSYKKVFNLVIFVLVAIFIIGLFIPLFHDFLFDKYSISNYEEKEGIVTDVKLKDKDGMTCEYIDVDDYNIFIHCGDDYKPQFKIGNKTTYHIYKDKAYHTKDQMKSGSFIGKVLDYGMIGTYILIFFLLMHNKGKIYDYVDDISGNKESDKTSRTL